MSPFPIPAPAFGGRSRAVGVGAVFAWLRFGWNVFLVNPGVWIVSALIVIAGFFALMALWLVGWLLACLLAPLFAAGLLTLSRRAAHGEAFGLFDLAAGFSTRATPLITLGAIFMLASLAIKGMIGLLLGGSVAGGLLVSGIAGLGVALGGSLLVLLLSPLLVLPLWMAMWFAPALVLFNGMSPLEACKASLGACLKNILPLLILGLVIFGLSLLAVLPAGVGFLVLLPVLAGTAYASYQDVFVA
jgi:uncharacterized membrane protein